MSLGMYIDDGVIIACSRDWDCIEWLTRARLNVDLDKMEFLFFKKRGERLEPPRHIHLLNPTLNTYYRVQATSTIRYLGIYFDTRFKAPCIEVVYMMELKGIRLATESRAQFSRMTTCMLQIWFAQKSELFGLVLIFKLQVLIDQKPETFRRIACNTVHTLQTGINSNH